MRTQVSLSFVIVGSILLCLPAAAEEHSKTFQAGVLFAGAHLPTPPAQERMWKAPARPFSKLWLSALEELMHHGFADPRGCEYREVSLTWGSSVWGGCCLVTTHAWVIPQSSNSPKESQRFAITWDGLVYPVVKLGPVADLKADVQELVKESQNESAQGPGLWLGRHGGINEFLYSYDRPWKMREWSERELVSCSSLVALKCCVLLRLGEVALAEKLWATWKSRDGRILNGGPKGDDPYMVFAWEWAWVLFDRAVAAHLRGDDVIALHAAKILVPFEKSVPEVAAQRGFKQFGAGLENGRDFGLRDGLTGIAL
jgi:hypothetical protein